MRMQLARDGGKRTKFYLLGFDLYLSKDEDWEGAFFGDGWCDILPEDWESHPDAPRLAPGEGPIEVEVTITLPKGKK